MKNEILEKEEVNVFNLIQKLRQEKLLVKIEKNNIQEINELIRSKTQKIIKSAWTTTKQRLLLYQRVVSAKSYQRVDYILNSEFVEAKKALGFQNAIKVGSLLHVLRSQPVQLAKWLIVGEQLEETQNYLLVLQSIVVGLYGCFIFPEDTKFMLSLLYELAKLQLLNSDNPRRIIKQSTCSFKQLYFLFHEVFQPAKFFLNTSLEMPIITLMSCTDYYLDVDPEKTIMRYNQDDNEISNTFKDPNEYRKEVVAKLVQFTNIFVTSLLENVYSFPKCISWIVYNISKIIEKSYGSKEANNIVAELIFTLYICPVIVDPEQFGICNAQVTDIARHNLIQIGKILQSLALCKYEPTDSKHADLYDLLDKNRVSNFLELLFFDMDNEEAPIDSSPVVVRDMMLFTELELNHLVSILQRIQLNLKQTDNFAKDDEDIEDQLSSLNLSRDNSPKSSRLSNNEEAAPKKQNFFSLGSKNHISRSISEEIKTQTQCNVVLIFPIENAQTEPIGLLPEEKILDMSMPVRNGEIFDATQPKLVSSIPGTPNQNGDIKQSFNFQDEGSIGNTSDNLEAISEAASNHSVDSSIELENEDQNDNLSDMVSANVSGRGTPNISGRDTPSSQVCENDDRVMAEARQADTTQPQQNLSRQIRSEIDDKFCKFEIKKLLQGDETISIISETWSTDVLASDNETIDAGDTRNERHSLQLVDEAIQEVPIGNILDISETQSESAWSTDVMTSDTERLTEVDNDDTVSVAQSDDTNSVARSDDMRSETDEIAGIRRLSSSSNSYASNIPSTSSQNYVSTVTVSSSTNYIGSANNPFVPIGGVNNNINYSPALPTNSTNTTRSVSNYVTSTNLQEYKKIENKDRINGKIYHTEHTDNNANTVFKSLTLNNSEHSITFSDCSSEMKTSAFTSMASTVATVVSNGVQNQFVKDTDLNNVAGPSGLSTKPNNLVEAENEYMKQNRNMKKYNDRSNEILLSNCSLNSSSSGSSSNSFDNKNCHMETSEQWENKQWLNSSGSSLNVTLTPSESTSELSVLSVNNITNPVNIINKKSMTLINSRILKPTVSTGAIPKSISFDMSADKGLDDDTRNKRAGFFGKLRIGFKNRNRGKAFRNQEDFKMENEEFGMNKKPESPSKVNNNSEVSENILAKYRTKPFVESSPIKENCDVAKSPKERNIVNINGEEVNSFNDIKNKLRLVLSNTSEIPHYVKNNPISAKNKIETVLRLELGKARKLREWSSVARISEAIRCVNLLNDSGCLKLLKSMREDIILRSTYIQYLVTSKQELLFCDSYLNSLQSQISHDRQQCERYLATECVRDFLSEQEAVVLEFCDEFKQLSLADEKCDFLHKFYIKLYSIMNSSPSFQGIFHNREKAIKITLERFIMSKVYKNSIYPNGDGDRDRDRVLHEHIEKLAKIITPKHKDLLIHKTYLKECPWLPAQDALRALNAYRTPRDKVKCVVHCAKCIMDLLSLSKSSGSTTADDFTPVLVYVIIKVNPEALLSTVQYVNSFFHNQLFGEEEYWWTQFCAAVEFIKTMDYSD